MSKEKKERTIDYLKKGHVVSDEIKVKIKEFAKIKRTILKTLETEHKTIPQIAKETNISIDVITKYMMTLIKYGNIKAGEMDEMEEYYFYELLKK
ncbi:MAG TPA: hypothetical protein ENK25_02285 [Bacteroidetes bacterium]|nr:hypothetical protein [Bacteroidota bacterium]